MIDNINYQLSNNHIDLINEETNRFEMQQLLRKTIKKMINIIRSENQNQ
jgi:hypothetical protein